ncbi:hypothetical protein SAMN04487895_105317 [Paenibacillus sophorae]|uniref:Uncharacterized protein n=1 Tax=Paenibacillus sophorae TaxID=1333845 RepID=A0A1H8MMZ7_9BACL|nr:hypothetical protein [Paenibacillus sophorae]QWU17879.1 hypothetical protein KP014_12540 [Paenibacillus sophorae]SEO18735.1 hypothetical protein SAMN04487895_105317 [Paenibacillus sophorae]
MQHDQDILDALNGTPLKVKGSLTKREGVRRNSVEVVGYLRVLGSMITSKLKVLGDCSIRNHCQAMQVENLGSLRVHCLQAGRVTSLGYLSVSQKAAAKSFQAEGAVRIESLMAAESIDIRFGAGGYRYTVPDRGEARLWRRDHNRTRLIQEVRYSKSLQTDPGSNVENAVLLEE